MVDSSRATQRARNFGLTQLLTLSTLVVAGVVLAVFLLVIHVGHTTLSAAMIKAIPPSAAVLIAITLWVMEILIYALLAWSPSENGLVTLIGIFIGLLTRAAVSIILALVVSNVREASFSQTLWDMGERLWPFRIVAILVAITALAIPFRRSLEDGFGLIGKRKNLKSPTAKESTKNATTPNTKTHFTFASTRAPVPVVVRQVEPPPPQSEEHPEYLAPPRNAPPLPPRESIQGFIEVPRSLILECIPEASWAIGTNGTVPVRLAYVVPQLPRSTVWVTWGQLFEGTVNEAGQRDGDPARVKLRDRWVRIPAKYYIGQVPGEHFQVRKTLPSWLQLPEVAQERDVSIGSWK